LRWFDLPRTPTSINEVERMYDGGGGDDCHFAFRTDDFDGALAALTAGGFREDAAEDDPMRVIVRRNGPAGFPQLFLLDPDRNIIEINGAA
jgi:glyoxylase I family protein